MSQDQECLHTSFSYTYSQNIPFFNYFSTSGTSIATKPEGREIAKLLISNGASMPHCIQGESLSDDFIVDVFTPRFIALADNDKILPELLLSNSSQKTLNKLPDEVHRKITTEHMPLFRQQLEQMCDIDEERAHTIHKLILDRVKSLNSDQLTQQRAYVLRDVNLLTMLRDTVFANIIGPIRNAEALDPTYKGSQFKVAFTDVFKDFISDKTVADFQVEGREKILQMARKIANQNVGQKNLTVSDLKIIFSVILAVATNDKQRAIQILEPLQNQSDKDYISQLSEMVKKSQNSKRWF